MNGSALKKAVILQQKTKQEKMSPITITSVGAALLNYRKAKADYEALVEKQEALQDAVRTYNSNKLDEYIDSIDTKDNPMPSGLLVTSILRVGNLVGKMMRAKASVVLTNVSSQPIHIKGVQVECVVLDVPVQMFKFEADAKPLAQSVVYNKDIQPGETIEIGVPGGISSLGEKQGELRSVICDACGKRLITSCPKISIEDGQKADIRVDWGDGNVGIVLGKPGVLRYCGEAFYDK